MNTEYQSKIILKIKKLREANCISQAKAAMLLGISYGQISNIESPKYTHKYTLKQIDTLCRHCNYPTAKIFMDEEYIGFDELIKRIILYQDVSDARNSNL